MAMARGEPQEDVADGLSPESLGRHIDDECEDGRIQTRE